jgi:hypothetical protein
MVRSRQPFLAQFSSTAPEPLFDLNGDRPAALRGLLTRGAHL